MFQLGCQIIASVSQLRAPEWECSSSALRQQADLALARMPTIVPLPGHTFSMRESPVRRAKKPCYLYNWTHSLTIKRIGEQLALQYFWVSYLTGESFISANTRFSVN